ncbi:DEAD/DEAH box helicase [Vibrio tubiashii]|uniref:helicase-related protein n=1 Tax=Vibrio tubiashii TaxID=29498 RepID=UPI001EFCE33E|nr:DEAD/DEAH box helicase [Vibrio tubiashii]MCG9582279.1 DEAD/DEAH box helicase [Vibrio tubiashii]MCG9615870.1 DEAD/DEAH box helicase [Vibrio tubiashii]MCG9689030.1 DEAD/DEAH box helicase [Vibrio tubiashii]
MTSLPIDTLKTEFLSLLSAHHLIVEAETGSGKSTRLPIWAAQQGRVLVIEPRRIACTSLAQFLSEQSKQPLGQSVGYAIKLESRFDENTQVVFVTPGVALRWFSENKLEGFDTVIVDEFHERRWDTDLLVALLKDSQTHRLVVTSATIEGEKLANYIGAKRMYAEGRNFNVSIGYRAGDSRQLPDARSLDEKVKQEVLALSDIDGDILVFLPGRKEISQCQSKLAGIEGLVAVPLHASVTDEQREVALNTQAYKKVVLATNVAETSLTIPNIVAVIDSGLERRTEQRNGRTALSLKHISKASAKQRSGRAGRVMDGICIRLYGEHAALSEVTPPEMHRESLTEAMLASASCGKALAQLNFLELLPERSLNQANEILTAMGAVNDVGTATEHGQRIYPLPIDALYADLVTRMPSKPLQEAMVDLTSVMATPANLYRLSSNEEEREKLEQEEPWGCDGQLAIGILRGEQFSGIKVDTDVAKEARALSAQMREVFELPQLSVASRYSHQELVEAIARLHPELVFARRLKRKEAMANGEMEVILGRETRFPYKNEAALVLDTHSLPGRGVKQTLNLATFTMPIALNALSEIGLGEWQLGEVITVDEQPMVEMRLNYAGRVIATRHEIAQGELAIQPMLEAVVANQLLPGFAETRHKQIEHWKLYLALGLGSSDANLDELNFESWFTEQLTLLELDDISELELFSADDFVFEGIPYWEYEDFASAYPFELALGDLNLDVEYHAKKKLVYVVHRDGLRKGYPKRWELPNWKGWRIQYKKASKIVDIK